MVEIWNDIPGFEGLYQASDFGRIKSLKRIDNRGQKRKENIRKPQSDKEGYHYLSLCKNGIAKAYRLHRLIAITFIENSENKPFINHINGVKYDNRVENLEWCTAKENVRHSWSIGLSSCHAPKGERQHKAKLTDQDVVKIFHDKGYHKDIAKAYGIDSTQVCRIKKEKTWSHVLKYI